MRIGLGDVFHKKISTSARASVARPSSACFSYAGVPLEEAERNVRLFSREVRPAPLALDGEARAKAPTAAEAAACQV